MSCAEVFHHSFQAERPTNAQSASSFSRAETQEASTQTIDKVADARTQTDHVKAKVPKCTWSRPGSGPSTIWSTRKLNACRRGGRTNRMTMFLWYRRRKGRRWRLKGGPTNFNENDAFWNRAIGEAEAGRNVLLLHTQHNIELFQHEIIKRTFVCPHHPGDLSIEVQFVFKDMETPPNRII